MRWNWQKADWPNFTWDSDRLRAAEEQFLLHGGMFLGAVEHLGEADREVLTVESISDEALTTSAIEGEILNRASVQSSVRKQLGLTYDRRGASPAEQGVAEMMVKVYRAFSSPLSQDTLFDWHRKLMNGRPGVLRIGQYRVDAEPMQVMSGAIYSPKVHFEAPPSSIVPSEMNRFLGWFNRTAPSGERPLPAVTRSGIAHLYFESIHPFEDGNGRIGRAISEKALAQAVDRPNLTGLAAAILANRKSYYTALEAANKKNEITNWLVWFAGTALEAQHRTQTMVEFLIEKTRLLDRLRGQLNARQEKALLRMLREGPEGFQGGMTAGKYVGLTSASPATATRDLADLVEKGALIRTGELRHARYELPFPNKR